VFYKKLKIAFDVGGVLSKYPDEFRIALEALDDSPKIEIFIISDIHPKEEIIRQLKENNLHFGWSSNVYFADYDKYREACKKVLCEQLGIHILVDDFIGYVVEGDFIRLLVMPNSRKPYWHDSWKTNSESDFGRRKYVLGET